MAGLGAMGGATARACARAGMEVIACDALAPPHDKGSSHGESRIIRAAYFEDPVYVPMATHAFALWRELEAESNRNLLLITGGLNIGPREGILVSGALTSAREHGVPHELLTSTEAMRRFPGLNLRATDSAVYEPEAGILNPEACIATQVESARRYGATIQTREPLVTWKRTRDTYEITTTHNTYSAHRLVLAVGAWLPMLRPNLPLVVTRQPVFWFKPLEPTRYAAGALPHYLIEFEPARVFYGFPDLGDGLKCAIHHEGRPTLADEVDRTHDARDSAEVHALARQFLPGAAGPLLRSSICLYTNTPDGHFLIDHDANDPGLWILSACSGHGFKFAPAIGELMTNALTRATPIPQVFQRRDRC